MSPTRESIPLSLFDTTIKKHASLHGAQNPERLKTEAGIMACIEAQKKYTWKFVMFCEGARLSPEETAVVKGLDMSGLTIEAYRRFLQDMRNKIEREETLKEYESIWACSAFHPKDIDEIIKTLKELMERIQKQYTFGDDENNQ